MAPLFKPGDLLCCRKESFENVRLGDILIIVWESDNNHIEYVVHRTISLKPDCLTTQGDNNLKPDLQVVTRKNFVGLVTSFSRRGHVYSVFGGTIGLLYSRVILLWNNILLIMKRLGWQVYRWIRQSGLIAIVWRPAISQIRVMTDKGPLNKYCYGNHTVARWWQKQKCFNVVKPFDLVIPKPEESK